VLTGLVSVPVGPVDASTYVSGLAAAFVVVAFAVGVRAFGLRRAPAREHAVRQLVQPRGAGGRWRRAVC
jgi:hypothetical protein